MLFDEACDRVLARFELKKHEIFTKKSVCSEKLENGKYVFEIQPPESWS